MPVRGKEIVDGCLHSYIHTYLSRVHRLHCMFFLSLPLNPPSIVSSPSFQGSFCSSTLTPSTWFSLFSRQACESFFCLRFNPLLSCLASLVGAALLSLYLGCTPRTSSCMPRYPPSRYVGMPNPGFLSVPPDYRMFQGFLTLRSLLVPFP